MEKRSAKLKLDPITGKLTVTRLPTANSSDNLVHLKAHALGFFGGSFVTPPDKDNIVLTPRFYRKKEVSVETMHIEFICWSSVEG